MKKGIICVMFVLSLHALCAQEQEDGRVSWGVRIGTNLSNQYCMIDDDSQPCLFTLRIHIDDITKSMDMISANEKPLIEITPMTVKGLEL